MVCCPSKSLHRSRVTKKDRSSTIPSSASSGLATARIPRRSNLRRLCTSFFVTSAPGPPSSSSTSARRRVWHRIIRCIVHRRCDSRSIATTVIGQSFLHRPCIAVDIVLLFSPSFVVRMDCTHLLCSVVRAARTFVGPHVPLVHVRTFLWRISQGTCDRFVWLVRTTIPRPIHLQWFGSALCHVWVAVLPCAFSPVGSFAALSKDGTRDRRNGYESGCKARRSGRLETRCDDTRRMEVVNETVGPPPVTRWKFLLTFLSTRHSASWSLSTVHPGQCYFPLDCLHSFTRHTLSSSLLDALAALSHCSISGSVSLTTALSLHCPMCTLSHSSFCAPSRSTRCTRHSRSSSPADLSPFYLAIRSLCPSPNMRCAASDQVIPSCAVDWMSLCVSVSCRACVCLFDCVTLFLCACACVSV
mmetsp:Transcript_9776/g.59457  ORF Transcript_9776/g.59457 Transcript_9776/m.59457 type:complete len:415 (+) Transcript_9776:2048-3292(+)